MKNTIFLYFSIIFQRIQKEKKTRRKIKLKKNGKWKSRREKSISIRKRKEEKNPRKSIVVIYNNFLLDYIVIQLF